MIVTEITPRTVEQRRTATRVYVVLLVALFTSALLSLYFDFQAPSLKFHLHTGLYALLTLACLLALWLNAQDRPQLASAIVLGAIIIIIPLTSMLVKGLGLALAVAILAGSAMISGLTLPSPDTNRVIIAAAVSSIITLLVDTFDLPGRLSVPPLQIIAPFLVGLFLVTFAVFMAQSLSSYSLRAKLLILLIFSVLLSSSLIALGITAYTRTTITTQVGERTQQLAEHLSNEIVSELETNTNLLQALSLNYVNELNAANAMYTGTDAEIKAQIEAMDRTWIAAGITDPVITHVVQNPISDQLRLFKRFAPSHAEIFLTDKYGANIAATNRTSDYYQADEEWWQAAYFNQKGAVFIGQPEYDDSSQTYAINLAVPVYDGGTVVGILRTTLNIAGVQVLLADGQFEQTGRAELRLADNSVLGGNQPLSTQDVEALATITDQPFGTITFEGAPSLVSENRLRPSNSRISTGVAITNLGWSIVVHQDVDEALLPVTNATRVATIIALGVMLAAVIIGVYFAQWLSTPIVKLTAVAEQLAKGNFETRAVVETQDEIGTLSKAFNTMSEELQKFVGRLEQRVAERTFDLAQASRESERRAQDLRSIAEVSSVIASEQKLEKLLPLITNLISEKFNFYHVGIFLNDSSGRYAILQAANSEGGQRMLARGHKLEVGQTGLVGFVAQTGRARIALDVGADAVFFSNPDLPETRSEMALPLAVRGETIGVLDVQSEKPGAFSQTDINTLSVLADQVAISIDNARLFGQAQRTLTETQALYNQYLSQQWQGFLQEERQIGYQQNISGGVKLSATLETDEITQALKKGEVVIKTPSDEAGVMVVPVRLRNQVIGVLNIRTLQKGQTWSPDEITMVQAISDRLALTLETARLFQEAQRRATTERAIGEVSAKLATAQDIDSILRLTAEELGKLLDGSKVAIQLEIGKTGNNFRTGKLSL